MLLSLIYHTQKCGNLKSRVVPPVVSPVVLPVVLPIVLHIVVFYSNFIS